MITIYHNPRCSKSRATMKILVQQGIEPTVIEYLKTPPSADELRGILTMLTLSPRELIRSKEDAYRTNNLDDELLSDDHLIEAMIENPILIERPIVIKDGKAVLGRPPENVEQLF